MGKPLIGKRRRGHVVRRLKALEPKAVEDVKKVLLIRGKKSSERGLEILRDIRKIKAPHAVLFSRKNDILPFEQENKLEFLCQKNDAGVFMFASHNKKRPHNLVIGRLFDGQILDMFEFGATKYTSFQELQKLNHGTAKALGSLSCVVFQGDAFEKEHKFQVLKSLLLDFFKGRHVEEVDLAAVDHCVVCSINDDKLAIRNYVVAFEKQKASVENIVKSVDVNVPKISLIDMGPSIDLTMRRHKLAAPALAKLAMKKPKIRGAQRKVKNVKSDSLKGKLGRIHMEKQDLSKLVTRSRFGKALKGSKKDASSE